jgi:hypothetical protein
MFIIYQERDLLRIRGKEEWKENKERELVGDVDKRAVFVFTMEGLAEML